MTRALSCSFGSVLCLLVLAAGLSIPKDASACGGFFCSNTQLVAVEQIKERILFTVNGDETLTVAVEVGFNGEAQDFAWSVPVPPSFTGDLGVLPPSTLRFLDAATAPQIVPPNQYGWGDDNATDSAAGGDDDDFDGPNEGTPDDGVDVIDLPQVGPYAPQLVSSDDAEALTAWLNENGYLITEAMEPYVANYVAAGMNFLCMKLAPESGISDIAPIAITYAADNPMIPLVLTSVSAEPEMGILVFIAADERYEPANYQGLFVDDELLRADPRTGETNYYPLLSYLADQFNRQAFFTEYSNTTTDLANLVDMVWLDSEDQSEARDHIAQLAKNHSWVSRLYTRMNNVDMVMDPFFVGVGTTEVSHIHDLSDQDPVHWDFNVDPQLECNDLYCGEGGVCASTQGGVDGCVCGGGFTARIVSGPNVSSLGTQAAVTCQDNSFDVLAAAVTSIEVDVCEDYSCGSQGTCVVVGGFPTCQCPVGTAAIPLDGMMSCEAVVTTYGPEQVLWPQWRSTERDDTDANGGGAAALASACANSCSTASGEATPGLALSLLMLLGLVARRRL